MEDSVEKKSSKADTYQIDYGIAADFDKVLKRFKETDSVRYKEFSKLWIDMNMSYIFAGKLEEKETREFTEECFNLAMHTFTAKSTSFQSRIGALYLLYALYIKQPCFPRAKIRITLNQWRKSQAVMEDASEQQHLDAVFIFSKLRYMMAFQFVATAKTMYPRTRYDYVKDTNQPASKFILSALPDNSLQDVFDSNSINQLSTIHDQYHQMKCMLAGPSSTKPNPALNFLHDDLVQNITKLITAQEDKAKKKGEKSRKRRDSGVTTSESDGDSDFEPKGSSPKKSHSDIRAEIRARAFEQVPSSYRSRRGRAGRTGKGPRGRKGKQAR